jgi:molybdopterin/thiamine biosynthesis adenylyltransferase
LRTLQTQRGLIHVPAPMAGFRPGCCPPEIELLQGNPEGHITRIELDRIDSDRLIQRTAGNLPARSLAVNLIGCGSVGGFLADGLVRSGTCQHLTLIDEQSLAPENVQRHFCGIEWVGYGKAAAVQEKLARHYPSLRANALGVDILDLLREKPESLKKADITVVALGDMATERAINRLTREESGPFRAPVAFVWVEPYLLGGHVLFLGDLQRPGCFDCLFDEDFVFTQRVVCDSSKLTRREAGCQTTHIPYSGLDLQQFTIAATRFLQKQVEAGSNENTLFTWTGDLTQANSLGVRIRGGLTPFAGIERKVMPNPDCQICRES